MDKFHMGQYVKVASLNDIPAGGAKCVEVEGRAIALFNVAGSIFAMENECNHAGGPMAEGMIEGDHVECPWHGARFEIKTGKALTPPASGALAVYPVRVQGSDVEVEI